MRQKNLLLISLMILVTFGLVIYSTFLFEQNQLLKKQNANHNSQNHQQRELIEAIRKNGMMSQLSRLLTKAEAELNQSSTRQLTDQTINQFATLSQSFELEPYNHFEQDSLLKKKQSIERGQLFMTLFQLNMDSSSFKKVKSKVSFEGANLEAIDLSGADLSNANFYCASFKESSLSQTSFKNADLRGANFSYSNLNGANLQETNLNRANMQWAELNGALLMKSDLGGINLSNAKLKKANLTDVQMTGANLKVAVFKEATMIGAIIKDTDLSRANMSKVDLTNADFRRANLSEVIFNEALMENVELTRAGVFTKNWIEMLPSWKITGFEEIQKKYEIADKAPGKANFELGVIEKEE